MTEPIWIAKDLSRKVEIETYKYYRKKEITTGMVIINKSGVLA
jgi:hypothetical protein